ncbi:MAG: PHP domain-containing protein [Clostridiales bacterium]|jgi:PHP family Zn ribbon phosphoesterase|nr:PHP domain-containing protein [Clostridiales bacterium]
MTRVFYDFHIHTALSPCADGDMTPCNIVNMAGLSGLGVIAVTDHNCTLNARACAAASKRLKGPLVIAGTELTTAEEIHVILLFPSLAAADAFEDYVAPRRLKIANRPEIFGKQLIIDEFDNAVGEHPGLLIPATDISVEDAGAVAAEFGAVAFPAHADKPANGITAILGAIPERLGFSSAEVSRNGPDAFIKELTESGYRVLYNSDAHTLADINERGRNVLEVGALTAEGVLEALRTKRRRTR